MFNGLSEARFDRRARENSRFWPVFAGFCDFPPPPFTMPELIVPPLVVHFFGPAICKWKRICIAVRTRPSGERPRLAGKCGDRLPEPVKGGYTMLADHRVLRAKRLDVRAGLSKPFSFQWALRPVAALAILIILSAGLAAQQCSTGYVLCPDRRCYPFGSQCCAGGGACAGGYNCFRGASSSSPLCCPGGTHGTNDGYCVPNGFQYCGRGKYCVTGHCDSRCASGCCQ
jgi:hypothetical protein